MHDVLHPEVAARILANDASSVRLESPPLLGTNSEAVQIRSEVRTSEPPQLTSTHCAALAEIPSRQAPPTRCRSLPFSSSPPSKTRIISARGTLTLPSAFPYDQRWRNIIQSTTPSANSHALLLAQVHDALRLEPATRLVDNVPSVQSVALPLSE